MNTGKTSAAIIGLAGGVALGMWIASAITLMDRESGSAAPAVTQATQAIEPAATVEPPPAKARRVVARPAAIPVRPAARLDETPKLVMTVPVTAPELHDRIKPVLARGTKMELAVEGFRDAEQFATLAHAARNTQVPFILLKHRVLTERQSLADAIRASNPDLDAEAEVERARSAAKADLAAISTAAD